MTTIDDHATARRRLLPPGDGEPWWLLGSLATVKAGTDVTAGAMTVAEMELPPGFAVPPHVHRDEDELFYVLDGEVTFWCDGEDRTFTRGGMAWLPRTRPHTFQVTDAGPARLFNIHTGPAFEGLIAAIGERAPEPRLPDPPQGEPDMVAIAQAFSDHGIDLVEV